MPTQLVTRVRAAIPAGVPVSACERALLLATIHALPAAGELPGLARPDDPLEALAAARRAIAVGGDGPALAELVAAVDRILAPPPRAPDVAYPSGEWEQRRRRLDVDE